MKNPMAYLQHEQYWNARMKNGRVWVEEPDNFINCFSPKVLLVALS